MTEATAAFAEALLDSDDALALLELLKPLLAPALFDDLCAMCEICPEHLSDAQNCADDGLDCEAAAG